jgi:hypothetical protein
MASKNQEIKIVVRGRNLAIFREGLRPGQILRGRVLAIYPRGKIIISLRGFNMMAETRGVKVDPGQTLWLMVADLTNKIELRWLQSREFVTDGTSSGSSLTLSRLSGALHRLKRIFLDNITENDAVKRIRMLCDSLRERAQNEVIFLPKTCEHKREKRFSGEVITPKCGLPAILRIFCDNQTLEKDNGQRFEFCVETENSGPMIFDIYSNDGELRCKLNVLNDKISKYGKNLNYLKSKLENAGCHSVDIELADLNEGYPEILNLLDMYSEECVSYRV